MAVKPTGDQLASKAVELVQGPTILYSQYDCQAFMELIFRKLNYPIHDYAGSNDMFRNACSWVGTIAEAKALGKLVPGAALFILEHNGKEPEKYKKDGLGNASHVGMYLGDHAFYSAEQGRTCDVAHSSASKGKVCGSTLKNGWTHVGLWKDGDFKEGGGGTMTKMYVRSDNGKAVNLRKATSVSSGIYKQLPVGTEVYAEPVNSVWSRVQYGDITGYMMSEYLGTAETTGNTTIDKINALLDQIKELVATLK